MGLDTAMATTAGITDMDITDIITTDIMAITTAGIITAAIAPTGLSSSPRMAIRPMGTAEGTATEITGSFRSTDPAADSRSATSPR